MCTCVSCSATHNTKKWPTAVGKVAQYKIDRLRALTFSPLQGLGFFNTNNSDGIKKLERMDKAYLAHVAYGKRSEGSNMLTGSPFPCTGTRQTDPHIAYHFPGGQHGEVRFTSDDKKTFPRKDERPDATNDPVEYVSRFIKANNLIT
mgnify:CR=1 FL=1